VYKEVMKGIGHFQIVIKIMEGELKRYYFNDFATEVMANVIGKKTHVNWSKGLKHLIHPKPKYSLKYIPIIAWQDTLHNYGNLPWEGDSSTNKSSLTHLILSRRIKLYFY